jgi:hypothetical protein
VADDDDPAEATARLEAALDRIADLASRKRAALPAATGVETAEIAARLDQLIAQLRDVLGS